MANPLNRQNVQTFQNIGGFFRFISNTITGAINMQRNLRHFGNGISAPIRLLKDITEAIAFVVKLLVVSTLIICLLTTVFFVWWVQSRYDNNNLSQPVRDWLKDNNLLDEVGQAFENSGFGIEDCAWLYTKHQSQRKSRISGLSDEQWTRVLSASEQLSKRVSVEQWLYENKLHVEYSSLKELGLGTIKEISRVTKDHISSITELDHYNNARVNYITWKSAIYELKEQLVTDKNYENKLLVQYFRRTYGVREGFGMICTLFLGFLIAAASLVWYFYPSMKQSNFQLPNGRPLFGRGGISEFISGNYVAAQKCYVKWGWEEPQMVGNTVYFEIFFHQYNGKPYPISESDGAIIDITHKGNKVGTTVDYGLGEDANVTKISFSVIKSGKYWIKVRIGGWDVRGSPWEKEFQPGPPIASKIKFTQYNSTVVVTEGKRHTLYIEPRDEFNNVCKYETVHQCYEDYTLQICEAGCSDDVVTHVIDFTYRKVSGIIEMTVIINQTGCFQGKAFYNEETIQNGDFNVIVLSDADSSEVDKNTKKQTINIYYKAKMLAEGAIRCTKPKTVYCYITPRQLTIKEFYWKLIPRRLYTFRVSPSTKFTLKNLYNESGTPMFEIDDGTQPAIELVSKDQHLIVSTVTRFLLKNIGGSETFKDKQEFFYHEVRTLHLKHAHSAKHIEVQRSNLLESSYKATESFSVADWCRRFEIMFRDEEGLDWGGLRREWFELICTEIFDPKKSGMFTRFKEDTQGLCHPNPNRPEGIRLRYYEFAGKIVGKCLYECGLGGSYYQAVKAKFTRSFLAQLIGLRVNYKHFEQDDTELYVSKIKYIEENDVDVMELYFVEEEYTTSGQLSKIVELCPGGSRTLVTNENKMKYLDCLAQHRLAKRVKEETERFLKGLNEIIPDNLLGIFDENELELLMCGTGECSVADLKSHHVMTGNSPRFNKIVDWFWTIVDSFNQEQMARLLQFTTGSSQLPPGGFASLNPQFQISPSFSCGNLPTAHTCFNQLCLPEYESMERFHQALVIAINEGSQGFGLL